MTKWGVIVFISADHTEQIKNFLSNSTKQLGNQNLQFNLENTRKMNDQGSNIKLNTCL